MRALHTGLIESIMSLNWKGLVKGIQFLVQSMTNLRMGCSGSVQMSSEDLQGWAPHFSGVTYSIVHNPCWDKFF